MTLVELVIVLAVLAILAAMAWPSLRDAVLKSRRSDAMAALGEIAQAQERWRANNPAYQAVLADLPGGRSVSHDGHYALSLADVNGSNYTALATVRSGSPQVADSRCQVLVLEVRGGNITYRSRAAGDAANGTPDPCWVR